MFAWTVIATTGTRFSDFAPYVASVNAAGTVAFQAALQGGGTGVFIGSGGAVSEVAGPTLLAGITSHPDLNDAGPRASTGTCRAAARASSCSATGACTRSRTPVIDSRPSARWVPR
jgi:hypothetical protein